MGTSLFFIDARVADIELLLVDMPSGSEVTIHIISHGSSGSAALGDNVIDSAALAIHAIQHETIGQSLTESGDILLSRSGC